MTLHDTITRALRPYLPTWVAADRAAQLAMIADGWEPRDEPYRDVLECIARARLPHCGDVALSDDALTDATLDVLTALAAL